jgi:hypothetical protein
MAQMIHSSDTLQQAFGYLTENELRSLKELAKLLPDNPTVINLGAGAGTSGLAFMESRPDLKLWTIDIQRDDSPFGCLVAEQRIINKAFPETRLYSNNRFFQMQGDSKAIGLMWQKPPLFDFEVRLWGQNKHLVDMVFIDGSHSYRGAKGDILAWLPNIKPGGIMAVHDFDKKRVYASGQLTGKVMHPLPWPGVDRAVRKFLCPYFEVALHVDTLISFVITEDGLRRLKEDYSNG